MWSVDENARWKMKTKDEANGQNSHYDTQDRSGEQEVTSGRSVSLSLNRHDRAFRRHWGPRHAVRPSMVLARPNHPAVCLCRSVDASQVVSDYTQGVPRTLNCRFFNQLRADLPPWESRGISQPLAIDDAELFEKRASEEHEMNRVSSSILYRARFGKIFAKI